VLVAASLASIVLLFLIEITKAADNPYLGIVTYVILPAFLVLGLVIIVAGMLLERRRAGAPRICNHPISKDRFERSASAADSVFTGRRIVHFHFHERLR